MLLEVSYQPAPAPDMYMSLIVDVGVSVTLAPPAKNNLEPANTESSCSVIEFPLVLTNMTSCVFVPAAIVGIAVIVTGAAELHDARVVLIAIATVVPATNDAFWKVCRMALLSAKPDSLVFAAPV